jgi:hypothetical protein
MFCIFIKFSDVNLQCCILTTRLCSMVSDEVGEDKSRK